MFFDSLADGVAAELEALNFSGQLLLLSRCIYTWSLSLLDIDQTQQTRTLSTTTTSFQLTTPTLAHPFSTIDPSLLLNMKVVAVIALLMPALALAGRSVPGVTVGVSVLELCFSKTRTDMCYSAVHQGILHYPGGGRPCQPSLHDW